MKWIRACALAACVAAYLSAQQIKLNLDQLSSKASNSVDISLNGATLKFAANFLSSKDPDESKVKNMISSLEGIYIRSYEFKNAGAWTDADIDGIRKQLRSPEWSRIVGVKSSQDGENSEIYLRNENQKITGVTIIATESKSLTVVNIVGQVDLDAIARLSGHLGIPKVEIKKK